MDVKPAITKKFFCDWRDVREIVSELNSELFEIIDDINPKLPIMRVKYPYGEIISDATRFRLPDELAEHQFPNKEFPYSLLLKGKVETIIPYKNKIIPGTVNSPGDFFPHHYEISRYKNIALRPYGIFILFSGVRSINVMPLMHYNDSYKRLAREFRVPEECRPEKVIDHHTIISSISKSITSDWSAEMLLFDKSWKKEIFQSTKWQRLREYIFKQSIRQNTFKRNLFYLEHAISDINQECDIRMKPFSHEVIKNILAISLGELSGLRPAIDNTGIPLKEVTDALCSVYQPPTTPVIIEPCLYNPARRNNQSIYYSLSASSYNVYDKKSFRPLVYLNEVRDNLPVYLKKFKDHPFTENIIYSELANKYCYSFYSVQGDSRGVCKSSDLLKRDVRFQYIYDLHEENTQYGFSNRSHFTKALISIEQLKESS